MSGGKKCQYEINGRESKMAAEALERVWRAIADIVRLQNKVTSNTNSSKWHGWLKERYK
jgi:hypothetical protein